MCGWTKARPPCSAASIPREADHAHQPPHAADHHRRARARHAVARRREDPRHAVARDERRPRRGTEQADRGVQRQPGHHRGHRSVQRRLQGPDDVGRGGVARRPGAAHRAGVRGRHPDHAELRPGDQAGLATRAGDRREDRRRCVHPGGARLLQHAGRAAGVDAVQFIHRDRLVQPGRAGKGRRRSAHAAADLAGGRDGHARRAADERGTVRRDHRLGRVVAVRAVRRDPQPALRHRGERLQGSRCGAEGQQPAVRETPPAPDRHGEGQLVPLHRTRRRRRRRLPQRPVRHGVQHLGAARRSEAQREVPLGAGVPAVRSRRHRASRSTRRSAAPASGC